MSGFDNQTMFANNVDFTGGSNIGLPVEPTILTNGQLIIGSTALNAGGTHINIGNLKSPSGTVSIGYSSPNITLDVISAPIGASNLGISYSGGTFTILAANGTNLSSTNPAYVTMPSVNAPGQLVTIKLTSNATFLDHASGSSQIAGSTFGVSIASGAYSNDIPFFLYAVLNSAQTSPAIETTLTFMISRMPNVTTTLSSTTISPYGGTAATTQGGFFALGAITATNYANSAALSLGSFRMQATASVADWTVQTLNASDGIGRFQENVSFSLPTGAFGAAAGAMFYNNGGAAPVFSNTSNGYYVQKSNFLYLATAFQNCTNAGTGSVQLQFANPYSLTGAVNGNMIALTTVSTVFLTPTVKSAGPNNQIALYQAAGSPQNYVLNSGIGVDSNFKFDLFIYGPINYA